MDGWAPGAGAGTSSRDGQREHGQRTEDLHGAGGGLYWEEGVLHWCRTGREGPCAGQHGVGELREAGVSAGAVGSGGGEKGGAGLGGGAQRGTGRELGDR